MKILFVKDRAISIEKSFLKKVCDRFQNHHVEEIFLIQLNLDYLNNFDFFILDMSSDSLMRSGIIRNINPKLLINGRFLYAGKFRIAEFYEKFFGKKLAIYYKDTKKYEGRVFLKPFFQTMGPYKIAEHPDFSNHNMCNQIYISKNENFSEVLGIYYFKGILLHSVMMKTDTFYVKLDIKGGSEYFDHEETENMMKPYKLNIEKMMNLMRIDCCRIDVVFDENNFPYIVDINHRPWISDRKDQSKRARDLIDKSSFIIENKINELMKGIKIYNNANKKNFLLKGLRSVKFS